MNLHRFPFYCFVFVYLLLAACDSKTNQDGFSIQGTITNCDRPEIYLFAYRGDKSELIDSANITDGSYSFHNDQPLSRGFYRLGFNHRTFHDIILGKEHISVESDFSTFTTDIKITNSAENDLYLSFITQRKHIMNRIKDVREKASSITMGNAAGKTEVDAMQQEYNQIALEEKQLMQKMIQENSAFFMATVGALILTPSLADFPDLQGKYENETMFLRDHYFHYVDFSNDEILNGSILIEKYFTFLQKFADKSPIGLAKAVELIVQKASANRKVTIITLEYLIGIFKDYSPSDIFRALAEKYLKIAPSTPLGVEVAARLEKESRLAEGSVAPEIILNDPMGKPVKLSSLRGQIVLIDFWASWCKPCRLENPNVVRLFNKYKDRGFTVFSVSLDNSKDKWLEAIREDNLTWTHVSDLLGWKSEAGRLYNVTSIPNTLLLDKEGKILARNMRGQDLERKLVELFDL